MQWQQVLHLKHPDGREVIVSRRGATAPGNFVMRRKGDKTYLEYKYFVRGTPFPQSVHIGIVEGFEDPA